MRNDVELALRLISNIAFNMAQSPKDTPPAEQFKRIQNLAEDALKGVPAADLLKR